MIDVKDIFLTNKQVRKTRLSDIHSESGRTCLMVVQELWGWEQKELVPHINYSDSVQCIDSA